MRQASVLRQGDDVSRGNKGKESYFHEKWEGINPKGRFTSITHDMQESKAWLHLNLRQQGLYLAFKKRYWRKRVKGQTEDSNEMRITMPKSEFSKMYGNKNTFYKDLQALIDYGFLIRTIKEVRDGQERYVRTDHWVRDGNENTFGFSAAWKDWKPVENTPQSTPAATANKPK
ncbi:MAG: hypothetical protein ACOX7B_08035 [Christensenellales bacterium]|jgi:hypothetical protein